jgi:hypothetical protein
VRTNDPAIGSGEPAAGPPAVSANPTGAWEGGAGTTRTVTITLTLSQPAAGGETVRWATADGTATAGSDYVAASGTATFAAGATSATITVIVNGDAAWESDETFSILLSSPTGLTLGASSAIVQILNDDASGSTATATAQPTTSTETTTTAATIGDKGHTGRGNGHQLLMASAIGTADHVKPLTRRAAVRVLRAAIRRWAAAGVRRAAFAGVKVRIARLGGARLAKVVGRTVVIDADAAGWGWHLGVRGRVRPARIDLLTVLLHELGHLAGLEHEADGLMAARLGPGERRRRPAA